MQLIIYKACFQRDKADGDSNDLQEGIAIANIPHYNGCWVRIFLNVFFGKIFDKKSSESVAATAEKADTTTPDHQGAEEIHPRKPIFKKFESHNFILYEQYLGADLADMQLTSNYNKGIPLLLSFFYVFNKYALVIPLKDKAFDRITKFSQKILNELGRKTKHALRKTVNITTNERNHG